MATTPETKIDKAYLTEFRTFIHGLRGELVDFTTPRRVNNYFYPPLNGSLSVAAGSDLFKLGADFNKALATVGGSIATQLQWLDKLFGDMDFDLGNTINVFTSTESLNSDEVAKFRSYFAKTLGDFSTGTTSGNPPAK